MAHPQGLPPEAIAEIRRLFYEENMSKRSIAVKLGRNYNTVAKYIPVTSENSLSNKEKYKQFKVVPKPTKKKKPDTPVGEAFKVHKPSNNLKVPAPPLPDAIERDTSPVETELPGWWWVLSDTHLPFHDITALELGCKEAKRRGLAGILLNGDTIDCYGLSSKFHKQLDGHMFHVELEAWEQFIQWLRYYFPGIPIYYKMGNHEERYEPYISKFPEIFGIKNIQFGKIMEFEKYGVTQVKDGRVIMLGKLPVLHGHEYRGGISAPVNPARGAYLKLQHTVLVGHSHVTSEHTEKDMFDEVRVVWSTGCNCTLKPRYATYNKWNHGGAFVEVGKDGTYEMHNYKIIQGVLR